MFQNFNDYDGYAFYAAKRLYFALKNNYNNQGKIIKGKLIRPIKSCLNYTKALLYPMKIEYQRETFNEVISEEFASKTFDSLALKENLKAQATQSQPDILLQLELEGTARAIPYLLEHILAQTPFKKNSLDYTKVKITLLLNCYQSLTKKGNFDNNPATIILWNLPKSMSEYIRVLLKKFYTSLKEKIIDCFKDTQIDDTILDKIISTPDGEYKEYNEEND